jgi:hypothetical protein
MMCKVITSIVALGYPTPTIIGFNKTIHDDNLISGGTHMAKIMNTRTHLSALGPEYDEDVVFIIDSTDMWLQLPPEILISRYLELAHQGERRLNQRYGTKAVKKLGLHARIFFSAQKNCGLNDAQEFSAACQLTPESTLPMDFLGDMTESGDMTWRRPRYINSGFVIGPVFAMRKMYEAAYAKVNSGGSNIGSDQYLMQTMLSEQEQWRRVEAEKLDTSWLRLPYFSSRMPQMSTDVVDWRNSHSLSSDVNYEYGIDLDETSAISQVTWSFETEVEYLVHDPADIKALREERNVSSTAANALPHDLQALPRPLHNLAGQSSISGSDINPTWSAVELVTNLWTGQVPAMVHMCVGWKGRIPWDWKRTWFFPHLRQLLDIAALRDEGRVATVRAPDTGELQEWYGRTPSAGLLATDASDIKHARLDTVCGRQWEGLLGKGQLPWTNPALMR